MPYATLQNIVDRYGDDALSIVADRDNDGVVDAPVVSQALDDASEEIDTWIGKKYSLPLAVVPGVLIRLCVDIALYRLSPDNSYTEEKRNRYTDALKHLKAIANGEASLGLDAIDEPESSAGDVELISPERQFSRSTMGRLL